MRSSPRIVVVHDYLTQRGGAERVVLAMLQTFPGSRVITSIYAPERTFPEFREHDVRPLLAHPPRLLRTDPRYALPVLARVFGRASVDDADVVVCSSSGWAHGIGTRAPKVVYCHTPARWLHEAEEYRSANNLAVRFVATVARPALKTWDARAAASATTYIVNSTFIAERVNRVYGRDAMVLHPPPGILPGGLARPAKPDLERPFLLTIARGRGYKNTAAVVEAAKLTGARLVIVGSSGSGRHSAGVTELERIDDATLRWLYANCRALVAAAYEDFGLTPVEAMSFGKPVVALRARGYLDSMVEGVTGVFFDHPTGSAIAEALGALDTARLDPDTIRRQAQRFSPERFSTGLRAIVRDAAVQNE